MRTSSRARPPLGEEGGWQGSPPAEICIVMLSAIGDAVHVLPLANGLKRAWPECRVTWVAQPAAALVAQGHPAIDDFIVFRRRRGMRAWEGFHDLMGEIGARRFDLLIGLQVYAKAGLITALTRARVKLGFDRQRARDAQWLVTNRRIPARGERHVQDQYLEFLEHLGIDPKPVIWDIPFSDDERSAQARFFASIDRPVCAVVVGTSKAEKNWTVEGYARALESIQQDHRLQPVIVGGPSESEHRFADDVVASTGADVVVALGDDLRRLMWIVDGSALVLSPDTGPLHISRALETPVVSLFGHTNPKRCGPYQAYGDLIVDGYAEYPGEDYPITKRYRDGMERIGVDEVLSKVSLAMQTYVTPEPSESS